MVKSLGGTLFIAGMVVDVVALVRGNLVRLTIKIWGAQMFLGFILLLFSLPLLGTKTLHLEQWPTPVYFAGKIVLSHERLYIEDRFDNKIKAFDVSSGLEKPKFLWATPGEGDGPGEKPKGWRQSNYC